MEASSIKAFTDCSSPLINGSLFNNASMIGALQERIRSKHNFAFSD